MVGVSYGKLCRRNLKWRLSIPERPFTFVGLDYFGPLNVTIGRRHEKRWGALFTCLSVRAIHLELVSSLDTDSAILAIRRFAARRGYPRRIVSDNGTNFKGAQRELKEALDTFEQDNIRDFCSMAGVEWQFNPPAAPHMGGVWERLVRSVKTALYAILNSQAPREETLRTVFCEVEYIINNRPLTSISMDPNDPQPLTPNHFLLGGPNRLAPAINLKSDEKHLKKQWRISQALADSFWRRWTREYLPQLNNRVKWTQETNKEQLQPGDVVVIWDGNLPRATWPKGVVTQLYPGKDGKVRVVEVRTSHGVLKRPVTGLVKIVKDN